MGKEFVGARKYMFVAKGIIDGSQHWHGKSYPWTSGIDPRIEKQVGDTSSSIE
jgi:hypothetical protein